MESLISTLQLKKLLFDLRDKPSAICIRFRLLGEMWRPNFMRVISVGDKEAIFNEETLDEFVYVADIDDIMQFEIDARFQNFQPHFHYDVKPELNMRK